MLNWQEARLLAIDTETTGTDEAARIVELALVGLVVDRRALAVAFNERVNPGCPIPPDATAIHHIGDDDVRDCPPLSEHAERIISLVRSADVLVGYNHAFDRAILTRELPGFVEAAAHKPVLDPLVIVRLDDVGRYWPGKGRHQLANVCERLGVKLDGAHGAAADATATLRLLWKLRNFIPSDAYEAAAFLENARVTQEEDFQAWLATQQPQPSAAAEPERTE